MIMGWIAEAVASGARRRSACAELGLDARTIQRWREQGGGDDRRHGPKTSPANKLTAPERQEIIDISTSPEFRDLSPKQIVPRLADKGRYIASESSFYRTLKSERLLSHRGRAKPPASKAPPEHCATAPCQVWSWDITYLKSRTAGIFYYLYLFEDVWSRKIVGSVVHEEECGERASVAFREALAAERIDGADLVLHQDNGAPMKGATLKATLERLGVIASYSRPRVSDDNPFSEALFRTMKYWPAYPRGGFEDVDAARKWVASFVAWYNTRHLHSGIGFVTPCDRHEGRAEPILARRRSVYAAARQRHPERWNGRATRAWEIPAEVRLNPPRLPLHQTRVEAAA
jgi:transposase InsO family protein